MKSAARLAAVLLLLLGALFVPQGAADASSVDAECKDCAYAAGLGNGECQHFLRNPAGVTDDPCWCDKCRNGASNQHHDGKTIPPGWNASHFDSAGMDGYLKRHSLAWGITCSECLTSEKAWPDAKGGGDLGTPPAKDFGGRPAKEHVLARLAVEKKLFKKPEEVVLAYNRFFYLCTDVDGLKVRNESGSERMISRHEWVHLMIERGCFARREWVRNMGEPRVMTGFQVRPIAVYIPQRQRDFTRIGAEYFKSAGSNGLRGDIASLCDGMCLTGMTFCKDECQNDLNFVCYLRHHTSHSLLSIWGSGAVRPKSLPPWMDECMAHWLTKSVPQYRNEVFFCVGEGTGGPSGGTGGAAFPGKDWDKDIPRYAKSNKLIHVEEMLAKHDVAKMTEEDQKRAWSWHEVCLAEWREPWVKMLRDVRNEVEVREAFTKNLGITPDQFDERWKERVTGKRKSMATDAGGEEADAETPGARDRRSLREEASPPTLAAKMRSLGEITDKKTIPVVVDVMARNSDLVRETALVSLLKTKNKDCLETIWTYGLAHTDPIVRAYTAKLCGRLKLEAAIPKLEAQLEDKNWYARAEAAVACGMLRHVKAMAGMRKMVDSDPSEKARIGALDALGMFGEDAAGSVPAIAKLLDSAEWQLRIVAAQTLAKIPVMECVEPLIARLEKEPGGRIADEIYEALKVISRDDLGRKAPPWRKWWEAEKERSPGGLPKRPEAKEKKKVDPNDKHATSDGGPPPYFGIEIYSNRIAFVIDTTETMMTLFTPDPAGAKALSREYTGRNKLEICKQEIQQALEGLDPRAHFNIVAFGMQIRAFNNNPVPASKGNISSGVSFLKSLAGVGRTNYYGALKAILDIGAEPDTNASFRATPDTITFLTDGMPNEGDINDAETLVEWYAGLNRYARVKTHTITFGTINVDSGLLKGLAERNGGRFTLVPELKKGDAPQKK
jgi:HEAT repeat protein